MTDGAKDVPVKSSISGYREINIPVVVTLQGTSARDIPVKVTLQGDGVKDVPVAATLETYRVDYGLYGESIYETAPRETIFYAQGGTPDKSIATTDPYWFIKSGSTETGKDGHFEIGFGQNDAHDQSDTNLTGFVRVQLDSVSGEGEVKIKPSLWFYPSAEPTTDQEGMIYYDSTAQEFKFYNGAAWGSIGGGGGTVGGSGTAGTITKWATGGTSIEDSVITESSGNITMSGDLTVSGTGMSTFAGNVDIQSGNGVSQQAGALNIKEDNAILIEEAGTTQAVGIGITSGDMKLYVNGFGNLAMTINDASPYSVSLVGALTAAHGDLTYGLSTAITLALGTDDTKAGAIRLYGGTAGGGGLIQATTNNLHIDALGGAIYLGNYDNSIIYFNGTSTYIAANGDTKLAGDLDVDGGTIEVANSYEIEYNSTSDSLDFNYIG